MDDSHGARPPVSSPSDPAGATPPPARGPRSWAGPVSLGASTLMFGPPFLVSCLVADIAGSFGFGAFELGIVLSLFHASGAVATMVAAACVDRVGARVILVLATILVSIAALGAAATLAWQPLAIMLMVAGAGAGIGGPGALRLLVSTSDPARRGFLIALRQSAAPLAAIVTGLAAPTMATMLGWRVTFVVFGAVCVAMVIVVAIAGREGPARSAMQPADPFALQTVALLITAATLLGAAASVFSGFLVVTAMEIGMSKASAGVLLAACSAVAIIARLATGWAADRRAGGHLLRVGALLFLGAVSCVVLAVARNVWVFIPAAVAVSATAWSSNALFTFAVLKNQPHAPGKAASIVQFGAFFGSTIAPFAFGFTAARAGASVGWLLVAVALLCGAGVVLYARRTFRRRPSG